MWKKSAPFCWQTLDSLSRLFSQYSALMGRLECCLSHILCPNKDLFSSFSCTFTCYHSTAISFFFFFPFLDMVFHTAFASQHSLQILSRKVQTILPFIESDKPWERNNVKELLVICQVTTRNKEGLQWKMYSYNPSSHRFHIVYFAKDIFAHFDNLQNNKDKV